ncbi:MAG: hypothetical protein FWE44_07885, partial [Defluviitaleaceae bacterium]|nr:hypothetical protein [Defluviitaleaceae bacterium]
MDRYFTRIMLQNTITTLDVNMAVFAELRDGTGARSYTGALHEPQVGVLFGEPFGDSLITDGERQPSAITIYVSFEHESLPQRVHVDLHTNYTMHGYNLADYSMIQIAWNFIYEGNSLAGVLNQRAMITEAARYLGGLDAPILLRVGAEMNEWPIPADPAEFVAAFRFIAGIMREYAPNVAMVYAVNSVSAIGLDWMMFYPGEEYVDWVGISLYTTRYFLGNPDTT